MQRSVAAVGGLRNSPIKHSASVCDSVGSPYLVPKTQAVKPKSFIQPKLLDAGANRVRLMEQFVRSKLGAELFTKVQQCETPD